MAFLHQSPGDVPLKKTDQSDQLKLKLDMLRRKIETGRHVKYWRSSDDLKASVIQAVSAETKRNPRVGWIRANLSGDPERLNKLLQENETLKEALSHARLSAPPGSEKYAQGKDLFEVEFDASLEKFGEYDESFSLNLSWNRIFFEVGPLLMDESDERSMRTYLSAELPLYSDEQYHQKYARVMVSSDSFQTIKVQFVALGFMRKSLKKHAPSDTKVYWSLTSFGEQYLTQLRAIKRQT